MKIGDWHKTDKIVQKVILRPLTPTGTKSTQIFLFPRTRIKSRPFLVGTFHGLPTRMRGSDDDISIGTKMATAWDPRM
jgi:hypothetical protein